MTDTFSQIIVQPFILFNLIKPWLKVFPISYLSLGFPQLIALMNHFKLALPNTTEATEAEDFLFLKRSDRSLDATWISST